ncbi:MAG TPA: ABC transporter substrate-binding protein [Stellaceae bacterium]|nr:ABC transporter substrate-binding protein [Stellaceae bacterium]
MRKIASRGLVLAAFVMVIGSPTSGSPAYAAETLHVAKAAATASPIIPVNVGYKLGIFAKHGLDLKIADFAGGGKAMQAMTAGSIDISISAGPEMALIAKGAPAKAICDAAPPITFIGIAVPWDSPVHKIGQLKGKKIGISSIGSLTDWLTLQLAQHEGWGPHGVTPVAIGNGTASIIAAFRTHAVDADVAVTSLVFNMEANKQGRLLIPASKFVGNLAAGTIYASDHLIATDPGAVRRFIAAWLETIDFIRTHKTEAIKLESEVTGFPVSVQTKEYDLTIGMYSKDCKFDAESLSTLKRSFVDLKLLSAPPDMSKLYTEAFLPKR